ncbi:ABC-2 type transport system permease protein [Oxalobacteraceae bacterium GrIS 1.11]
MIKIFLEFLRIDLVLALRGKIGMFWTLFFPALMLILQMTLFGGGSALGPVDLCVVNLDGSPASAAYGDYLARQLARQSSLKVKLHAVGAATNTCDLALTIPSGFGARTRTGQPSELLLDGKLRDNILLTATRGIVAAITDAYNIESSGKPRMLGLVFASAAPSPAGGNYLLYLVTGLAGMIVLSTSLMDFGLTLVAAREGGMFKLYQLFPIKPSLLLLVWCVSRLLLCLGASGLMFVLASLLYGLRFDAGVPQVAAAFLLLTLGAASFLAIGILIAAFSSSTTVATLAANSLYFPLLFTGNVMVPLISLPKTLRDAMELLPLNALVGSMRDLLSGQINAAKLLYTLFILLLIGTLSLLLAFKRFSWRPQS